MALAHGRDSACHSVSDVFQLSRDRAPGSEPIANETRKAHSPGWSSTARSRSRRRPAIVSSSGWESSASARNSWLRSAVRPPLRGETIKTMREKVAAAMPGRPRACAASGDSAPCTAQPRGAAPAASTATMVHPREGADLRPAVASVKRAAGGSIKSRGDERRHGIDTNATVQRA